MFFKRFLKNAIPSGNAGIEVRKRFKDENACNRCGQCCHLGFIVCGYYIMAPELPCKHLVKNGNGKYCCEVYKTRDKVKWCNPCNEHTVKQGLFPPDCAYVQGVINYHGKTMPPKAEREKVRKAIRKIVKSMPRPEYINPTDWAKFLKNLNDKK